MDDNPFFGGLKLKTALKKAGGKREGAGRPRRNGSGGALLCATGIVYLTGVQRSILDSHAESENLTISELLRRIVEGYLEARKDS